MHVVVVFEPWFGRGDNPHALHALQRDVEARTGHPFYMYDHIQAGPKVFAEATRRNLAAADRFAAQSASWRQGFLVGTGTSYHAARIGEHLVRAHGGGLPVRAWHSFDLALYGPGGFFDRAGS